MINVFKTKIEKIIKSLEKSGLSDLWSINKDIIDVCKDCEYRYMCVDENVPVKRKEREWFIEKECNYNPYISKWRGEAGYQTLSECGVTCNANEFKIDKKKLGLINKKLWS